MFQAFKADNVIPVSDSASMDRRLFGLGNPLLDMIAEVEPEFLTKYEVPKQGLLQNWQKNVFTEIAKKNPKYIPGGATQNSIRIAQWLIGTPNSTTFMGCIGSDDGKSADKFGEKMEEVMKKAGVETSYQLTKDNPTGTCAVCIDNGQRSLLTYLGASKSFTEDHLTTNMELVKQSMVFYMASYVLEVCPNAMITIGKFASENNRICSMSVFVPHLCEQKKTDINKMLPYLDLVFANTKGLEAFSKANGLKLSKLDDIALHIANGKKENGGVGRVVVVYDGTKPTFVAHERKIDNFVFTREKDIKDNSGEVDAFVGGFLAELMKGCSLDCCIASGHYAANYILRQVGVQLPDAPDYKCTEPAKTLHAPPAKRDASGKQ